MVTVSTTRADARPAPVRGSIVKGQLPNQPTPRAAWSESLPALVSSPSAARELTRWFIDTNHVDTDRDVAELITSELVTNAVNAMTAREEWATDLIQISWRKFEDHLLIEVIDPADGEPAIQPPTADAERGRGLTLVDTLTDQHWGYFWWRSLKVVWAALETIPAPRVG